MTNAGRRLVLPCDKHAAVEAVTVPCPQSLSGVVHGCSTDSGFVPCTDSRFFPRSSTDALHAPGYRNRLNPQVLPVASDRIDQHQVGGQAILAEP